MHFTCIQSNIQGQQSIICIQTSFASSSAISSTFNPLSKVLFMFPSWYLFAIGVTLISSLWWKLPPNLRSNSKERDSYNASRIQRTTQPRQACHLPRDPFQNIYMCTFVGIASEENNSRSSTLISMLGLFLFIRHYLRIPIWFQILHLLICLNSAGYFAWCHVHTLHKAGVSATTSSKKSKNVAAFAIWCNKLKAWCTLIMFKKWTCTIKTVKTLTQACPQECPKGTSAFNGQLIHGILQFTMIIALRCTLHQHVNQDICCWK